MMENEFGTMKIETKRWREIIYIDYKAEIENIMTKTDNLNKKGIMYYEMKNENESDIIKIET
jgi:hypothetical protein